MSRQGVSEEEATKITKETITEPGYSEHHTGLAVDVVDQNWYNSYPSTVLMQVTEISLELNGSQIMLRSMDLSFVIQKDTKI